MVPSQRSAQIRSHRFPRAARLLQASDFEQVFARPERIKDAFFTVLAVRTDRDRARLGLAVSKRRVRRAVDRNRIKRLIREAFRQRQQTLAGIDLVVMAGPKVLKVDNRHLVESLLRHLDRLASTSPPAPKMD